MPAVAKKKPTIILQRTRHPLQESSRAEVVRALQPIQSGCIELFLQLKNAHWNVRGNSFSALHRIFDEASEDALRFTDDLAERMAILGGEPLATVQKIAAVPQLADAPIGIKNQEEFVKMIVDRLSYYTGMIRDALIVFERNSDPVTSEACVRGLTNLEKKLWMLESHLLTKVI